MSARLGFQMYARLRLTYTCSQVPNVGFGLTVLQVQNLRPRASCGRPDRSCLHLSLRVRKGPVPLLFQHMSIHHELLSLDSLLRHHPVILTILIPYHKVLI